MADTIVKVSGPLFSGRAARSLSDGAKAVRKGVVKEAASRAREFLIEATEEGITGRAERSITTTDHSVVMITGKYTMPVTVEDPVTDIVATTSLASYGPWLEGTGSRNQTTRFKGHFSFQKAAGVMQFFAKSMADELMQPYIEKMR